MSRKDSLREYRGKRDLSRSKEPSGRRRRGQDGPVFVVQKQRKNKRGDRLFLDIMRDAYAQTVVAPFSVRARPGAHVATPLHWEEVEDSQLTPERFTMSSVLERLEEVEDPWSGLGRHRHGLGPLRERLARR
jgi:bifunctional non-homologous end joining protein LigD